MKTMTLFFFKWYFFRDLTGRYISAEDPKRGRYSKRQLKNIYSQIQKEKNELEKKSDLKQYKKHGNRLMVFFGVISLGTYKVLRKEGLSHQYATLLVADIIWKIYILGAKLFWLFAGLVARDAQKRLNLTLRMLCKYPFNSDPKGYQFNLRNMPDHLSMDFSQCVVQRYMKTAGNDEEMDFFRNSWCLFDFALPGYLIEGGGYEREHTLSHGDKVCDMKWYAKSEKNKNEKNISV